MYYIVYESKITGYKGKSGRVFLKSYAEEYAKALNQEHRDIKLVHTIQPETFDEWCTRNKVVYYKESFYHYIMSKGTPPTDPDELEALWNSSWNEYLPKLIGVGELENQQPEDNT